MPTEHYSPSHKFRDLGLNNHDNVVKESQIGWAYHNLYFPGVSTCTAVVMVLEDAMLLGAHFDQALSGTNVQDMLDRMKWIKRDREALHLAVFGNLTCSFNHGFTSEPGFQGEQQLKTFRNKFGVRHSVSSRNRGVTLGTHYRARSAGTGRMILNYDDGTAPNGSPVEFDRNSTTWKLQSLTTLL